MFLLGPEIDILLVVFMPKLTTIDAVAYCDTLKRLVITRNTG